MNTRRKLATTSAIAIGLAFVALQASAQDAANGGDYLHLGRVILGYTADGTPIYAGENTSSLDENDLMLTGGAAPVEGLLRQQTSVFTQQDIGNPAIAVNIRGFEGSGRVSMSVDGVPQNFRITGHAAQSAAYVDKNLLATIDITRGAVTTVGGSGIAGSVDFRTISAEDVVQDGKTWGGLTRFSYGDNANAKSGMVATAYKDERFSALLALSRSMADDYDDGDGNIISQSWEDVGSGLLKFGYNIGNGQSLSFSAMRYSADFYANSYGQEVTNDTYTFGYKYDAGDGLINLDVNAYYGKVENDWVSGTGSYVGRQLTTKTTGVNATNVSELSFGAWDLVSVNGFDYSKDDLGGTGGGVNPTDGTSSRLSVFSENIFTSGNWEVTAGLRYSSYSLKGDVTTTGGVTSGLDISHDSVDPKLTVAYQVSDWFQPYVTISKATRAPTLQETMMSGSAHSTGMTGNPDLEPETSKGVEIGFNIARTGVFTGGDTLTGRVNFYRMDIDNYVVAGFTSTGASFVNVPGTSKTKGYEVELAYSLNDLEFGLAYTRNDSDMPSQMPGLGAGQYLPDSTLSLSIAGKFLDDKLTVGAQYDYVSGGLYTARYSTTAVQRDESYELVDIFAIYKVSDNFSINARVDNVFDKAYIPWLSSDENGPGRSAYLGGEIRF